MSGPAPAGGSPDRPARRPGRGDGRPARRLDRSTVRPTHGSRVVTATADAAGGAAACAGRGAGRVRGPPAHPARPVRPHRPRLRHRRGLAARPPGPPRRRPGRTTSTSRRCAAGWPRAAPAGTAGRPPPGTPRRPGRSPPSCAGPGLTPDDVGLRLVSPKAHRTLPDVLAPDQARAVVDVRGRAPRSRSGLRDAVVLELLYASGIRVSELVGLDIDDVDRGRRLLRVLGKGRKERSVPYGAAGRARARRLAHPRPPGAGDARLRPGAAARRARAPAGRPRGPPDRARGGRRRPRARRTSGRTGCGTPPRRTCSRAARTSGPSRSCSATLASRRPRSTRT